MACESHVIGPKLEAGSELVYVTSILCDNDIVPSTLSLSVFLWLTLPGDGETPEKTAEATFPEQAK